MNQEKIYPKTRAVLDFILSNPTLRTRSELSERFKGLDQHLYILKRLGLIKSVSSAKGTFYEPCDKGE